MAKLVVPGWWRTIPHRHPRFLLVLAKAAKAGGVRAGDRDAVMKLARKLHL